MKASLTFKTIYLDAYIVDVLVGEIKLDCKNLSISQCITCSMLEVSMRTKMNNMRQWLMQLSKPIENFMKDYCTLVGGKHLDIVYI